MDQLLAMRGQLNARLAAQGKKLSVNDFIIKASALVQAPGFRISQCQMIRQHSVAGFHIGHAGIHLRHACFRAEDVS